MDEIRRMIAVEKQRKRLRRQARDGVHRVLGAVDALMDADGDQTVAAFRAEVDASKLTQAVVDCRAYEQLEQRGELDAMLSRYSTLRQYLPSFFGLPFQAAAGSEPLLQAIEVARALDDLTADMLQGTSRWFLSDETLRAANTILVNYHHSLPLSRVWGDGSRSSSDGQRFMVQRDSLLGSVYPRYFGYYDRALAFYTHAADQHSVYATVARHETLSVRPGSFRVF
jgi:Tn3 transposase DDE domain